MFLDVFLFVFGFFLGGEGVLFLFFEIWPLTWPIKLDWRSSGFCPLLLSTRIIESSLLQF